MKQKLLYICLMILCALAWSGEVWGEEWSKSVSTKYTYGSSDYNNNNANPFKFSNTSDGHQSDKVTINFSLSGGGLSRYRFGAFGIYEYSLRGQNNNGSTATFGWTVPDAYDIRVTKVSSTAKTSVTQSTTLKIGSGTTTTLGNSGTSVSSGDVSLGVEQSLSYYYKTSGAAYFHLYDFSVDYTLYQYRFYAKSTATAVPASGGTAYTSFTSYNAATNSSATKTSDWGRSTSASTDIYYKAAVASANSYVFKGWTLADKTTYTSTNSVGDNVQKKWEGFTYNGANSDNPSSAALKAWFAPLCNFKATASVGNTGGGTVKVSAGDAILENATGTAIANNVEGTPGTSTATQTFTYTATPSPGYEFVRWENTDGTLAASSAECKKTITNDNPGSTENLTLVAIFEPKSLTLDPETKPNNNIEGLYKGTITLSRTLKAGYSTIALPFFTTVAQLTKRTSDNDWVAQLDIVTYNAQDGYTLYFQKVDGGTITANQPYVLHLGSEVKDPTWTDLTNGISVEAAVATSVGASTGYSDYEGWKMWSNFTPNFAMAGKYGIVNSEGGLMLGSGDNAKLNAFTAYIAPPQPSGAPRLRVAYVDEDGTATFIGSLPEDDLQGEPVAIYGPDGQRRSKMQRGVNIVRYSDGTTRKINY